MAEIKFEVTITALENKELDEQANKLEIAMRRAGIQGEVSDEIDREEDNEAGSE